MGKITGKQIGVSCEAPDTLLLDQIMEFQGDFKKRDRYDIENIKKTLKKYGIAFPLFVWESEGVSYCLDGHGRRLALLQLQEEGYVIPLIPVVYIIAKDQAEAVQKLLRLNSRYGTMTEDSVTGFTGNIAVDWSEIAIPGTEIISFMPIKLDGVFTEGGKPKEKKLKKCPYCGGIL